MATRAWALTGAGRRLPDGTMEWGKYSEESFYATMGRAAPVGVQASSDAGQHTGQSKKGRRREAAASKKKEQPPPPPKAKEMDEDEAKRRLQVCSSVPPGLLYNIFLSEDRSREAAVLMQTCKSGLHTYFPECSCSLGF